MASLYALAMGIGTFLTEMRTGTNFYPISLEAVHRTISFASICVA